VGSHSGATNASVANRAGMLNAVPFERTRAQAIGTLKGIAEDGVPIWEATHSASGHRLTEVSDGLSTWSIAHDPLGRVIQAIDKEFVFDPLGRLVLVKVAGEVVESLHYDGDGRLARVNRHDSDGYTPSVFVYEGEQMTSSWTNSGSWSRDWQAVWGPSQDELLEFHDFVAGRTLRVIPDHRNSIAALIDESTGQIHSMARYTPEGLMRVLEPDGTVLCDERASLDTTCSLPIPFGFNGMWRSEASGLSYMRNRWYSPQLAQFMSHDPLEYIDSYNLYAFATLDPINFWDPWGLESWTQIRNSYFKSSRTPVPKMRDPDAGMVRVWLVEVKIQRGISRAIPIPFFNHSVIFTLDGDGRYDNTEVIQDTKGNAWQPENRMGSTEGTPFPNQPKFQKLWDDGEIERIYETQVPEDQVRKMLKAVDEIRVRDDADKFEYKAVWPTGNQETNCNRFARSCIEAMDLVAPDDFVRTENVGSRSSHPLEKPGLNQ